MADSNEAQLLSDLLRELVREDARLDAAHLETRVMSAAARSTAPSSGATRLTRRAVVAAVAVAALGAAAFWTTMQTPVEKTQLKVDATEEVIAQESIAGPVTAKRPVPPGAGRTAKSAVTPPAPPTQTSITQSPIAELPIAQSPIAQSPIAQLPIAQLPIAQSPIAQSHDEFVPLLPMTEQELAGPFQIVRVQMPRASLGNLRSPLEYPNELVEADVLLGEDGMARAIRVPTNGSVYSWRSR